MGGQLEGILQSCLHSHLVRTDGNCQTWNTLGVAVRRRILGVVAPMITCRFHHNIERLPAELRPDRTT